MFPRLDLKPAKIQRKILNRLELFRGSGVYTAKQGDHGSKV
jgi:hypothetical protein